MDSPAHDSERAPARGWRDGTRLFLAGLAVATVGLGLNWVARTNTDLVPLADFSRLGGQAIRPWLDGRLGTLELIVGDHEPGQKLSHVLATAAIGQWDARVLSIQSAVVQAAALAALGCFLIWALGRFRGVLAVVGFFAVAFASGMGPRPSASATVPELVITLGALQLVLAHGGGRAQLAGRCLAVFALLLDSLGLASVLAVALAKLTRRRTVSVVREFSFGDAALVVLGVGLVAWRGMRPETVAADAGLGAQSVWALFAAIPAGFCVWRSRRATAPDPILPRLSGAAWWALLLLLAGALWPGLPGEFTWAAFAINLACLGVLPRRGANWPARNVALGGLWTVVMVVRLLHPPAGTAPPVGPAVDSRDAAALRRAVLTHENAIDPGLLPVLPNSIRRPMSVAPSVREIRPGFSPGAAPELPGRDGWRTWGTWTPEGGGRQGTFLSEPLQTDFSLLQIRVAGRLQPPELSLVLVTSDGREIAPMETRFVAEGAWKRVNFAVPAGEFRIKAVDASDAHWIAFTGPAEVSRVSWLANKVARSGLGWAFLGAGAALAGAGVVLTLRTAGGEPIAAEATFDWRVAPWLAVLAYGLFWSHHLDPTAGPNDSGGYLNAAKLFAGGSLAAEPRGKDGPGMPAADITAFMPTTFRPTSDGRMAPEYPVGFPLIIAAMAKLVGLERAVPTILLLHLLLGVLFTQRLAGVLGLRGGWSWFAAALVGFSPVYLFQGLQPQSDVPALVWVTAAVFWAWQSRERPKLAIAAGLATALAVTIRPANVLCFVPVVIGLWGSGRRLGLWALAGLPFAAGLAWYNAAMYGAPWRTGYGSVGHFFGAEYAGPTIMAYAKWLPLFFTPLILLAVVAPFRREIAGRVRALLGAWGAVFAGFYLVYWCTHDNWYNMRFVLPAAPALLIAALLVLKEWSARRGWDLFAPPTSWRAALPTVVLVGAALGWAAVETARRQVMYWMEFNQGHRHAALWLRDNLPRNAVVFAKHTSNSVWYYTDLPLLRMDQPAARAPETLSGLAAANRPIYALTQHWERAGFQWGAGKGDGRPDLPGRWERMMVMEDGELMVWRWVGAEG